MTRRCPFCHRLLECAGLGGAVHVDTWVCPGCQYQESYGMEKLPDPDHLRREAELLDHLADDIEDQSGLAGRLAKFTHG